MRLLLTCVFLVSFLLLSSENVFSQTATDSTGEKPKYVPERLKYYKEKYEAVYETSFEVVWNAIKDVLNEKKCGFLKPKYSQNEKGLYKGTIKSDFCVFTEGGDTTFRVLNDLSYELPFIRGGVWANGRMEYKFIVTENENGTVKVVLIGEMSGYESHVTNQVHFWKSNGVFETKTLEMLDEKVKKALGK